MTAANVARLPGAVPGKPSQGVERPLRCADVMRSSAYAVAPDTPVAAAARLLATTGCSGVPVVSRDGRVIGLVTEVDLVRPGGSALPALVRDVMTAEPLVAPSRYDLAALIGLMLVAGTSVVPVVDGPQLVGMVDLRDLVRIVWRIDHPLPASRQAPG
ncbi:MAG: CBS domain-containing protein [Actinomycetota bacterium]|nr:CBS domain-containing protein [Actinomycetota bacterium]